MYLKSIELQGFKSFPDRTKLEFDKKGNQSGERDVTVIVGPNGSGKSNIADAMRWVLGEISSKTLRGTKMEDVIFGGADSRRPMGFAEVSVTFDNTSEVGKVDCPYDEITVTRRYFRAGESEYFINRKAVRLKDIYELFMNTGIGRDGYSIIGQGRIAEMVSRKSEERRGIFEDASGIAKYRHKKNESERKLQATEDNLVRVRDIYQEVESQVVPLGKEAEKAKRAIELLNTKKQADIGLWLYDTERLRNEIAVSEEAVRRTKFDLDKTEDALQSLEVRNDRLFEAVQSNKTASEQLLRMIKDTTDECHRLESEFRVNETNIEHSNDLIKSSEDSVSSIDKNIAVEDKQAHEHRAKIQSLEGQKREIFASLDGNENDIEKCKAHIEALSGKIASSLTDIKEAEDEATNIRIRVSVLESSRDSDSGKNSEIVDDIERYEERSRAMNADCEKHRKEAKGYSDKIEEYNKEIEALTEKNAELNRRYGECFDLLNGEKLKRDAADQRINTIRAMEESYEGYSHSTKFVMQSYKDGNITDARGNRCGEIYGPLSRVINVEEKYIVSVETALGQNLQNIVVEDESTAKAAMFALKRAEKGRATFFPLTSMRPSSETQEMRDARGYRGYIAVCDTLVSCDDKFSDVVSSLLGRTVVFDNIDNANTAARDLKYKLRIVTLDGQQINVGGSFTGGSANSRGGALSRHAELERLEREIKLMDQAVKERTKELADIKESISECDSAKFDIESNKSVVSLFLGEENSKLEKLEAQKDANEQLLGKLKADYEQIITMSEQYGREIESLKLDEKEIAERITAISEVRQKMSEDMADAEEELEKFGEKKTALMLEGNNIAKDIENAEALLRVSEERILLYVEEKEVHLGKIAVMKSKIADLNISQSENRKAYELGSGTLAELNAKREELEEGNSEFEKKLNELNAALRRKMSEKEVLFKEYTVNETKLEGFKADYDKLSGKLWEDYELTRADAVALGYPSVTKETRTEVLKVQTDCKNKLRAIGNVDLDSVDKYKELKERYDYMTDQITDIEKSKKELEGIISSLENEMKTAFIESFNKINENFGIVFSELFGGGSAELSLTDPDNILESGIEIKAAPPGKIIKNLMQLSGGEQAFIGVALFFAILQVTPTPFCILDEIEAALDEVNVERLAQYIKRYSDGTQFIIITHRRGTMAAASRLYGVTMPEHGISKILTLDINDISKKKEGEWDGIFG